MAEEETAASTPPSFPFLRLPLELREQVYSHYFHPGDHLVRTPALEAKGFFGGVYRWDLDIFYASKQVYRESRRVWRRENVFVKIATPWPNAGMYRVYLLATDGVREQLRLHGSISLSGGRGSHRELLPFPPPFLLFSFFFSALAFRI
jgi:hypothetical protein